MTEVATAKLFMHGRRTVEDYRAIFAEIDRLSADHGQFMPEGREQPPMPPDDDIAAFD